jgi:hypothetical protein
MESCTSNLNIDSKRTSLGPFTKNSSNVTPSSKIKELKKIQRRLKRDHSGGAGMRPINFEIKQCKHNNNNHA